ncbi:MAG: cytochrome c3 family protein [Nitrospirota bacterium]
MKLAAAVALGMALMLVTGSAFAVPAGKTLEWNSTAGKVVFDGKSHAEKGIKCAECHTGVFPMKKGGTTMTMESLNKGTFCGACHNGTKAFGTNDPASCAKCHKK